MMHQIIILPWRQAIAISKPKTLSKWEGNVYFKCQAFLYINFSQVKSAKLQNILGSEAKLVMNRQRSQLRNLIRLVKLKMSNHVIFAVLEHGEVRI